jgi:hypothetical protein
MCIRDRHTSSPTNITFFRPIISANFPENGREIPAEKVNKPIIHPIKGAPPNSERMEFISGITKLKLVVNKNMDKLKHQKLNPKFFKVMQK